MCTVVVTADHRFSDAAGYLQFYRCLIGYINDPENFDHTKYEERKQYDEVGDPLEGVAYLQKKTLKEE